MKIPIAPGKPITLFVRISGCRGTREILGILDTGASFMVIPTEDAVHTGYDLSSAPRRRVLTASGAIEAPRIVLEEVSFGDLRARDVPALCYDMPAAQVSCLIGLSLLERFTLTLDFTHRTMEILEP